MNIIERLRVFLGIGLIVVLHWGCARKIEESRNNVPDNEETQVSPPADEKEIEFQKEQEIGDISKNLPPDQTDEEQPESKDKEEEAIDPSKLQGDDTPLIKKGLREVENVLVFSKLKLPKGFLTQTYFENLKKVYESSSKKGELFSEDAYIQDGKVKAHSSGYEYLEDLEMLDLDRPYCYLRFKVPYEELMSDVLETRGMVLLKPTSVGVSYGGVGGKNLMSFGFSAEPNKYPFAMECKFYPKNVKGYYSFSLADLKPIFGEMATFVVRTDSAPMLDGNYGDGGVTFLRTVPAVTNVKAVDNRRWQYFGVGDDGYMNKIYVAADTGKNSFVARIHEYGKLDKSFGGGGIVALPSEGQSVFIQDIISQGSGVVVLATRRDGQIFMRRYLVDGSLDSSFGSSGKVVVADAGSDWNAVDIRGYGDFYIVVGGSKNDFVLARVTRAGALDSNFGNQGIARFNVSGSFWPRTSGWIGTDLLIGGVCDEKDPCFVKVVGASFQYPASILKIQNKFGYNGVVRVSLAQGQSAQVSSLVVRSNEIYLGTCLSLSKDEHHAGVYKFKEDGSFDTTFGPGGSAIGRIGVLPLVTTSCAVGLSVDSSKRVLVLSESWSQYAGFSIGLARLKADGTFDSSFGKDGVFLTRPRKYSNVPRGIITETLTGGSDGPIIVVGQCNDQASASGQTTDSDFEEICITRLQSD